MLHTDDHVSCTQTVSKIRLRTGLWLLLTYFEESNISEPHVQTFIGLVTVQVMRVKWAAAPPGPDATTARKQTKHRTVHLQSSVMQLSEPEVETPASCLTVNVFKHYSEKWLQWENTLHTWHASSLRDRPLLQAPQLLPVSGSFCPRWRLLFGCRAGLKSADRLRHLTLLPFFLLGCSLVAFSACFGSLFTVKHQLIRSESSNRAVTALLEITNEDRGY